MGVQTADYDVVDRGVHTGVDRGVDKGIDRGVSVDLGVDIGACVGYLPSHPSSPLTYVAAAVPTPPSRNSNNSPSNTHTNSHSSSPSIIQPSAHLSMHSSNTSPIKLSSTHPSTPPSTYPVAHPSTPVPLPSFLFPLLPPMVVDVMIPSVAHPHKLIRTPGTGGKYMGEEREAEMCNSGGDGGDQQLSSSSLPTSSTTATASSSSSSSSSSPPLPSLPYKITDLRSIPPYIHHVYATPTPQSQPQPHVGLDHANGAMAGEADGMGSTWRTITTPVRTVAGRRIDPTGSNDCANRDNDQNSEVADRCADNRGIGTISQQGSGPGQGQGPGSGSGPGQEKEEKEKRCAESDVMARLLGAFGGDWLSR